MSMIIPTSIGASSEVPTHKKGVEMPKSIELPALQNTEGIIVSTGEMKAIAHDAIQREVEERQGRVAIMRERTIWQVCDFARLHTIERMLERAAFWKNHYDVVARRLREGQFPLE